MAKDNVINIRTDAATKQAIERLYSQFGITVSDAVNIFFRKSLMEGGLPFEMKQPRYNRETEEAIQESRDMSSGKIPAQPQSVDSFFEEMGL
ncbi:type II toxin-antitoxin system RelB/DinJ family antitoxin [Eisenbergiella sp.]